MFELIKEGIKLIWNIFVYFGFFMLVSILVIIALGSV